MKGASTPALLTAKALQADGLLPDFTGLDDAEILAQIAKKISWLLKNDQEQLIRIAYRLDLPEKEFNVVMHEKDAASQIALLIFKRQWEKALSRIANRKDGPVDDELAW